MKKIDKDEYLALHFGFEPLDFDFENNIKVDLTVEEEKEKVFKKIKNLLDTKKKLNKMFFYKSPVKKNKFVNKSLGLDIINIDSAVAEATLIKTAVSILKDEGYKDFKVILSAVGDNESKKSFKSALISYYKENKDKLKPFEIKKISKDPFSILFSNKEYLEELNKNIPSPMQFLSKKSIDHFQEVIKFLESFKLDYFIDEGIISDKMFFSKIVFKIMAVPPEGKEQIEVAYGGRYDEFLESLIKRRNVHAIGLNINFKKNKAKNNFDLEKEIKMHLYKIGSTAKLKYLNVLDELSNLSVKIRYDIKEEKITNQVKKFSSEEVEYSIILGELEAKKDKVLIRKMDNFSQTEVPIKNISKYLKKIL